MQIIVKNVHCANFSFFKQPKSFYLVKKLFQFQTDFYWYIPLRMTSSMISDISRHTVKHENDVVQLKKEIHNLKHILNNVVEDDCSVELNELRTKNAKLLYQKTQLERALIQEKNVSASKMTNIQTALNLLFETAICNAFPEFINPPVSLTVAQNSNFGDYQCNSAMAIAKLAEKKHGKKLSPVVIAEKILENLPSNPVVKEVSIAGPGFINIILEKRFVCDILNKVLHEKVHPPGVGKRKKVIIDFSSPNIAKEMHVGHLRSSIIGESLARLLEFLNHDVLRLNHVGDWGTQFGMLIAHLEDKFPNFKEVSPPIEDLQSFYKASKKRFDEDEEFKKRAYQRVVNLQGGNPDVKNAWKLICDVSRKEFQRIYDRLDITLIERGESYYNDLMPKIVEDLKKGNICEKADDGRWIAWAPNMKIPLILVKSDGGFTYDTSDLAALHHRLKDEHGEWVIYVVDAGQGDHFKQIFGVAQKAGWYNPSITRVDHVAFGVVLGEDKKKFKTRSGDTVRLSELLDEGLKRSMDKLIEKERDKELSIDELKAAQSSTAYGCIKYADLCHNRLMDYVFSFDKMLDDKGNTAVYLLYAYTRIRSIQRKAKVDEQVLNLYINQNSISLSHEKEWKLGKLLCRFPEVITRCANDLMLHPLCEYLYELASTLTEFYDACYCIEINRETGEISNVDLNRIAILETVAKIFETGFYILGLKPITKM
ncbi:arginine--tRNA ligase, cytoplasmic [Hydra vulgaris]|uniref:arginine--tRNA ligase n=1 Tax=Hydra vulgaris TaxID=6087 RepID=A0ABM4D8X4_HYDVU